MPKTELIEFKNNAGDILRGILTEGDISNGAVLMCAGFERNSTTEKKFKALADKLSEKNIASLRFDYTGCGLSDGDFSNVTIKRMSEDAKRAIEFLKSKTQSSAISMVGHSISGCVAANLCKEIDFEKMILIGPALNQRDLLRFWFTVSAMKKQNSSVEINWSNYKNYLDEKSFLADCARTDRMTKTNFLSPEYFIENKSKDYSDSLRNADNILLIHGDKDDKVPLESLGEEFASKVVVKGGDHDLERPDMFSQWENRAVEFLSEI